MTTQTIERPTDTPIDNDDWMVHISEPPFTHGLCGAPLRGIDADGLRLDCVVCAELCKL